MLPMFHSALQSKTIEDILLYVSDASIWEAKDILTALGCGADDVYCFLGMVDITELCMSFDETLPATEVNELTFQGGPNQVEWFCGNLQRFLYDRILQAAIQQGPNYVAEVVGLSYGGTSEAPF